MIRLGRTFGLLGSIAAAFCAAAIAPAARAEALSVCIDKASPSASMDRKLAKAVASQEGLPLTVHEFDGGGDGDDGFAINNFRAMASGNCQLVLGFPVDMTSGAIPPGMRATAPYAHVGFVLVTRKDISARDLSHLPKGMDVAVTYLTTPNLYFETHPNINADVYTTEAETMSSFAANKDAAALLWRPTVAQYVIQHPAFAKPRISELKEPHARWNIVALYAGNNASAADRFQQGIDKLRVAGQLAALLTPYATPAIEAEKHAEAQPQPVSAHALPNRHPPLPPAETVKVPVGFDGLPPALYTQAQAAAGQVKFAGNCSVCHGKDLTGMAGPALKGKNFASVKANFHVGDVFKIVSQNMPATQPGSLPAQDYVEIMAFLLQQNGYPAGSKALTFKKAEKSKVPLIYNGQ